MQDNNDPQTAPQTSTPTPVAPAPVQATPPTPPPAAPKKGLSKVAKIIIGVVVGFIVLVGIGVAAIFLIVNVATQAPVDVSNKFFDNLQANQPAAAYELTSSSFKEVTTEANLESLFEQVSPFVTGEEKVTGKKIQSANGLNQAAVAYSVENGGETRYARVVLQETDGKWAVINFKTSATALEAIIE